MVDTQTGKKKAPRPERVATKKLEIEAVLATFHPETPLSPPLAGGCIDWGHR